MPHNNNEASTIPAVKDANPRLEQFRNNLNKFDQQANSNNVSLSKQSISSIVEHKRSILSNEELINLTSAKFQQQFINLYVIAKEKLIAKLEKLENKKFSTPKKKFSTQKKKVSTPKPNIDTLFKQVNHMFLQATLLTRYVIRKFMKTRSDGKYIFNHVELNEKIVLIDMVNIYMCGESGNKTHKRLEDYEEWLYPKLSTLGTQLKITFICVKPFWRDTSNTLISSPFHNIVIINTYYPLQEIYPVTEENKLEYRGYFPRLQKTDYVKNPYRYTVNGEFDIEKIEKIKYFAIKSEMPAVSAYTFDTTDDLVIAILWIVFYYCNFHVSILSTDNFAWFRINSLYKSLKLNKCIKFGITELEQQASYMHRINTFIKLFVFDTAVEPDFELVLSKDMDKRDRDLIKKTLKNIEKNMPHISDLSYFSSA